MPGKLRSTIWLVVATGYLILLSGSYLGNIDSLLFFSTIPWSLVIALFAWPLVHMSSYSLNSYLLIGGLINLALLIKVGFFGGRHNKHFD